MTDIDFLSPLSIERLPTTHIEILSRATGSTGVVSGNRITPSTPADMEVHAAAGRIRIAGAPLDVDADTVTIDAADTELSRIDIVYRDITGNLAVAKGENALIEDPLEMEAWHNYVSPVPPTGIAAGAILCAVWVEAAATEITSNEIWMMAGRVPDIVTLIGSPGSDALPGSEQAIREAITAVVNKDTYLDQGGANEVTAVNAKDAVTKKHTQGTDTYLDQGGANEVTAANAKDAVTKKHEQNKDQYLDYGGASQSTAANVKSAVDKKHDQNKDSYLDQGGANEVTAANAKDAVTKKHTQGTDTGLDTGGSNPVTAAELKNSLTRTITYVIDGSGAPIATGIKGDLEIPFGCNIMACTLLADQSGSIVIDIWKDSYANFPPTIADTIVASAKPTISAALKSQDVTLSGWTKAIAAGSILRFNVDSCSTIQRVTLSLKVTTT